VIISILVRSVNHRSSTVCGWPLDVVKPMWYMLCFSDGPFEFGCCTLNVPPDTLKVFLHVSLCNDSGSGVGSSSSDGSVMIV